MARNARIALVTAAGGIALLLVACGGGSDDGNATPAPTDTPVVTATSEDGGNGGGAEGMVKGQPVADFFQVNCSACHGADRRGISGLGLPLLPDALTEADDFYLETIKNGRPGTVMPAWGQTADLGDAEIRTIIAFLRTEP
jgi:cytochrome c oxidase cbb3-type subunit 3